MTHFILAVRDLQALVDVHPEGVADTDCAAAPRDAPAELIMSFSVYKDARTHRARGAGSSSLMPQRQSMWGEGGNWGFEKGHTFLASIRRVSTSE